jgi:hypothetical protein
MSGSISADGSVQLSVQKTYCRLLTTGSFLLGVLLARALVPERRSFALTVTLVVAFNPDFWRLVARFWS